MERAAPDLPAMVSRAPESLRESLLAELIKIDATYRRRRGEAVGKQAYLKQFPDGSEAIDAGLGRKQAPSKSNEDDDNAGRASLEPGAIVGRYRIIRPLGAGRFGDVHLARDESLGRDVAIKTLRVNDHDELLMEEARMAARLRHPSIAAIHDTGRLADGRPFLVLEYLPGTTLRSQLEDDPQRFSVPEAARMVSQLADAAHTAHQQGIIHRDLCPENVMVDEDGRPTIMDFGLSMHDLRRHEHAGEWAGTLAYMAPEQLQGEAEHLDGRADVWALGILFYELVMGRRPFGGASVDEVQRAILNRPPPPLRRAGERVPGHWERAARSCLTKCPGDRCATAGELAGALSRSKPKPLLPLGATAALAVAAVILAVTDFAPSPSKRPEVALMVNDHGAVLPLSAMRPALQEGDDIFLELAAAVPSYFHVWWIDSQGTVRRLSNSPQNRRTREQRLPQDPRLAWPLPEQAGGLDTLVVLASDAARAPELASLPRLPPLPKRAVLPSWFANGHYTRNGSRAGPVDSPHDAAEDPLGDWHRQLADRLLPHGELRAVTFSCLPSAD